MKSYNPDKSTVAQRKFVKAISSTLDIKYTGKLMNKAEVQSFIQDHLKEYRRYREDNNLPIHPTNKQIKFIKSIVKHLNTEWEGETLEEAKEFLDEWIPKFWEYKKEMIDSGEWSERHKGC